MTGPSDGDVDVGAPVDFDRLDVIAERLATDDRFDRIDERPEFAPDRVVCAYDPGFYPSHVHTARLELVWFENGDFSLHYHEDHDHGHDSNADNGDDNQETFDHRWDRHPSDHNAREHIHPGPDAPTPGTDAAHPPEWRDVLSMALAEIEDRQRGFWRNL